MNKTQIVKGLYRELGEVADAVEEGTPSVAFSKLKLAIDSMVVVTAHSERDPAVRETIYQGYWDAIDHVEEAQLRFEINERKPVPEERALESE